MRCQACGTEVIQQAVYCHKCGERLDLQEQRFAAAGSQPCDLPPGSPAGQDENAGSSASPAPAESPHSTLAARPQPADEPEREIWQGGFSPLAMIGAWCTTSLVTILLLVIWGAWVRNTTAWVLLLIVILLFWLYQFVALAYRRVSVHYLLTTQRLIFERGILRRVTDRLETIDIDDITLEQKVLERMVGVGTIIIRSSDASHPRLVMPAIESVREVAGILDEARRAERRRRGLYVERI